jgi:predicted transposase YbfD/YdcC
MPGATSAFVISSKDLFAGKGQWDVFYHDWKAQYRYVRELLTKRKFAALRTLLREEMYSDPSHGRRSLAPEVIAKIKDITGDLLTAVDATNASRL